MSNKKLESLKAIHKVKVRKMSRTKGCSKCSSSSTIRLYDDPRQYKGTRIMKEKIFSRI